MNSQNDQDRLSVRDVYTEVGMNYRYFLTWRHRLFAGYFALLAALGIALSWLAKEAPGWSWTPFAIALVVSLLFWALEIRNRSIYRNIYDSGAACEKELPAGTGVYTGIRTGRRGWISHSRAMDAFYVVMILAMIIGLISAVCTKAFELEPTIKVMQADQSLTDR